ncbi:transposon Ty3-I Gag-Pol polyprotein [Trichonephila clavipes]|nr:transposon Ty3-I Gag-Pol polyprotein [Trichonephila clavipes]
MVVTETTLDTMLPFCPNDFDDNNITKIAARAEESRQLARVHTLRAQDKDRRRYDSKHQMVSYAPGDLVWLYSVRKVGLSRKILKKVLDESDHSLECILGISRIFGSVKSRVHRQLGMFSVQCCIELPALE